MIKTQLELNITCMVVSVYMGSLEKLFELYPYGRENTHALRLRECSSVSRVLAVSPSFNAQHDINCVWRHRPVIPAWKQRQVSQEFKATPGYIVSSLTLCQMMKMLRLLKMLFFIAPI